VSPKVPEFRYEMRLADVCWECTRCGGLVVNTDRHDAWHIMVES